MASKKHFGGFVYNNTGRITECYTSVKLAFSGSENAGFACMNAGTIDRCFTRTGSKPYKRDHGKKRRDGFVSIDKGDITNSFFLCKKRKENRFRDPDYGLPVKEAEPDALRERYGWDFDVFQEENAGQMDFLQKTWRYTEAERRESAPQPVAVGAALAASAPARRVVHVQSARGGRNQKVLNVRLRSAKPDPPAGREPVRDDPEPVSLYRRETVVKIPDRRTLLDVIDEINSGEDVSGVRFELTRDIRLHGKKLQPIGVDKDHPFTGVFDGCGHTIRGFTLKGKGLAETGFFGHIAPGALVCNLRTDGIVRGKGCPTVAAFCAVNEGTISCCEAVCDIKAERNLGAFAAYNGGSIERCAVSGVARAVFLLPVFPWLPAAALAAFIALNPILPPPDYVPVPEEIRLIPNEDTPPITRSNENKASIEVPKRIDVDAATLTAIRDPYVIKNPNRGANYDLVAAITMTASNGSEVLVYQSGRIPVGYRIQQLTLTPPAGVTLARGEYDAMLRVTYYHSETGEKGMIDSTVPITIRIQ